MRISQAAGHDREAGGALVAVAAFPGQALDPRQVLRERVAMRLLLIQFLLRPVCAVG